MPPMMLLSLSLSLYKLTYPWQCNITAFNHFGDHNPPNLIRITPAMISTEGQLPCLTSPPADLGLDRRERMFPLRSSLLVGSVRGSGRADRQQSSTDGGVTKLASNSELASFDICLATPPTPVRALSSSSGEAREPHAPQCQLRRLALCRLHGLSSESVPNNVLFPRAPVSTERDSTELTPGVPRGPARSTERDSLGSDLSTRLQSTTGGWSSRASTEAKSFLGAHLLTTPPVAVL